VEVVIACARCLVVADALEYTRLRLQDGHIWQALIKRQPMGPSEDHPIKRELARQAEFNTDQAGQEQEAQRLRLLPFQRPARGGNEVLAAYPLYQGRCLVRVQIHEELNRTHPTREAIDRTGQRASQGKWHVGLVEY